MNQIFVNQSSPVSMGVEIQCVDSGGLWFTKIWFTSEDPTPFEIKKKGVYISNCLHKIKVGITAKIEYYRIIFSTSWSNRFFY